MKTSFKIFEYFKGVDYSPTAYDRSYSGIYSAPCVYTKRKISIGGAARLCSYVPTKIFQFFESKRTMKIMLWTERIEPCSKYVNKVEWLL